MEDDKFEKWLKVVIGVVVIASLLVLIYALVDAGVKDSEDNLKLCKSKGYEGVQDDRRLLCGGTVKCYRYNENRVKIYVEVRGLR